MYSSSKIIISAEENKILIPIDIEKGKTNPESIEKEKSVMIGILFSIQGHYTI